MVTSYFYAWRRISESRNKNAIPRCHLMKFGRFGAVQEKLPSMAVRMLQFLPCKDGARIGSRFPAWMSRNPVWKLFEGNFQPKCEEVAAPIGPHLACIDIQICQLIGPAGKKAHVTIEKEGRADITRNSNMIEISHQVPPDFTKSSFCPEKDVGTGS